MNEEAKTIRLPEGYIERSLGGCLALLMGLTLIGAAFAVSSFSPFGVVERAVKIAAIEFLTMLALYCLLVLVWCVCQPRWVQRVVNRVMKNFLPLVIFMSISVLLFLSVSLALA